MTDVLEALARKQYPAHDVLGRWRVTSALAEVDGDQSECGACMP